MTSSAVCTLCGSHGNLDFCIFTIPFEYALKIRELSSTNDNSNPHDIFEELPPPPLSLETAECFLLCNECKIKVQQNRSLNIFF